MWGQSQAVGLIPVNPVTKGFTELKDPLQSGEKLEFYIQTNSYNGAFTLDVKSVLNENLGHIPGGTQC
jgi:hypothetical protein